VVLRSIRYGEADRILHLYSADRGRVNAIAKGSRRPKSRFGGRLEPFFRLDLMLHEGRSDLLTVTGASTVAGYPALRSSGPAIEAAARASEAVLRLLDSSEPNRSAYNLLCRYFDMLEGEATAAAEGAETPTPAPSSRAAALAFRLKLALAAGFVPELAACARCGSRGEISAFSGVAGGVVCSGCEASGFRFSQQAHEFMVAALGRPLAELPEAGESALRQVERATTDVLSHHAHVQLRAVA
jgi:DNA repair protein RecO (recombination protein O)